MEPVQPDKTDQALKNYLAANDLEVPASWIRDAKNLFGKTAGISCPHCGKPITPFKSPLNRQHFWNAFWLGLCVVSFALSFVFPYRFLQFLTVSILAGLKWMLDRRSTKTQILVYKALQHDAMERSSRGLHETPTRL